MPGPSTVPSGSVRNFFVVRVPISTAALAAGPSTQERTFFVPGLLAQFDVVLVQKPTFQNTIAVGGARVSADNTLAINFIATAGTPTPTVESYLVTVIRHDYPDLNSIPPGIS